MFVLLKRIALVLLSTLSLSSYAQMPVFKFATPDDSVAINYRIYKSTTMDSVGNSYYTGSFQGSIDLDPSSGIDTVTAVGGTDIFLYSLDSNGIYRWGFSIGGSLGDFGMKVVSESSGSIILLAYQSTTIDLDPDAGVAYTPSNGKGIVARYDNAGHFLGGFDIPIITNQSSVTDYPDLTIDHNNNIIVTGYGQGDMDPSANVVSVGGSISADIILAKYSPALQLTWAFSLNSTRGISEVSHQVVVDSLNNIYIAGYFSTSDTVDFDPGVGLAKLNSSASYDVFFAKYSPAGVYQWAKNLTTNVSVYGVMPIRLNIIPGGRLLIFGYASAQVDLNPGPFTNSYPAGQFIAQYMQSNGSFYSAANTNVGFGNVITDLNCDKSGRIYITGSFKDSADFDMFTTGVYKLYANTSPYSSEFVASYNSALQFRWARNITTTTTSTCGGMLISADRNGYVLFSSRVQGVNDMNPTSAQCIVVGGTGFRDVQACWMDGISPSFTVRPGDADNSGVVDMADLLTLGVYYNDASYPRDTISNSWADHPVVAWGAPLQINGQDRAHADCDGNGIIDANDTLAIIQNFGLIGAARPDDNERILTPIEVHFVPQATTYHPGDIVRIHVIAGSAINPYSNLLGAEWMLPLSSNYIFPNYLQTIFNNSVLSVGNAYLKASKVLTNGITAAIVKKDHLGVNGNGELGVIQFMVPLTYTTPTLVPLQASQLKLIDANGSPISAVSGIDTLYINMSVGLNELNEDAWNVYPNPITNDRLFITGPIVFETALLRDISGRIIESYDISTDGSIEFPSSLPKGTYLLEINTLRGKITKRVIR